jgi:hypothetical protein
VVVAVAVVVRSDAPEPVVLQAASPGEAKGWPPEGDLGGEGECTARAHEYCTPCPRGHLWRFLPAAAAAAPAAVWAEEGEPVVGEAEDRLREEEWRAAAAAAAAAEEEEEEDEEAEEEEGSARLRPVKTSDSVQRLCVVAEEEEAWMGCG